MKIIKNMLYIAVVTIALTYFSCNSKLTENKDVKHTQTSNKAANGGTQTTQTPAACAGVNAKSGTEVFALINAATDGHLDIVKCLVSAGVDVNAEEPDNKLTALMWAAQNDHLDVVKYLVSASANVDTQDTNGETALMMAAENDHLDVVQYLATPKPNGAGADVTLKDNQMTTRTACDRATGKSNEQAMKTAMRQCQ